MWKTHHSYIIFRKPSGVPVFHIFFPSFQPPIVGCFRKSSAAPCGTEKLHSSAPYDLQGFKQLLASFSLGLRSFQKLRTSQDAKRDSWRMVYHQKAGKK
jgi:hypothetical protein